MKSYNIAIKGIVRTNASHDEIVDNFIAWVKNNNYKFYGTTQRVNDYGDDLERLNFVDID